MKGEIKECPKCGGSFKCNSANIQKCACINAPLNSVTKQMISENYEDCLCLGCLIEISNAASLDNTSQLKGKPLQNKIIRPPE